MNAPIQLSRRQLLQGVAVMGLSSATVPVSGGCTSPASTPKMRRIGVLSLASVPAILDPFRGKLRELGYLPGENITVEYRFTLGVPDAAPALAAELVGLDLDVLVTGGNVSTLAAKNATNRIPIVGVVLEEPVALGLVQDMFGPVNEKQQEYLKDVLGSGQHLLALINDLLDLSKVEAGRMTLELTTFPFRQAVDSGLTTVRERAARHRIAMIADVADEIGMIEADERKVKQVLYNLLSNAAKFTPDGGRIEVIVKPKRGDVRVEVRDTGIGIAKADQERVFEEFQQVGRERSREGTGLGLTLSRRFVELHGGRIWVESEAGKGSTFGFSLPLRQPAAISA